VCLGVPGRVVDVAQHEGIRMGRVDFGGISRSVCLEHVDVVPGDWVLVHVGFALTRLEEAEATELLRMLRELGEVLDEGSADEADDTAGADEARGGT
jgi:hydrogenase expression/formation protein HypC